MSETNYEFIKTMKPHDMARLLNDPPRCTLFCKDFKPGCLSDCEHDEGVAVLEEWLNRDWKDD